MTDKDTYAKALNNFRMEFMPAHLGTVFNREQVYRYFGIGNSPEAQVYKKAICDVLYNLAVVNKNHELEQVDRHSFRVIETTLNEIKWWESNERDILDIRYPYGIDDNTEFGFENAITLFPGDVIGLTGEGNTAKTTTALNLLVNNFDKFPAGAYLFSREFNDAKFRERIKNFDWIDIIKDGKPIFHVAQRSDDFQDVIVPDALNIIDWIALEDEQWKVRGKIDAMQKKIGRGLLVVIMQKRSYHKYGEGGESSKDLCSLYLSISYDVDKKCNILKVEKVKTPVLGAPQS